MIREKIRELTHRGKLDDIYLEDAGSNATPVEGDRAVMRPQVFMLNGSGPTNPPQTILFSDGSDTAEDMYELLASAGVDFSIAILGGSASRPFVHSRRLSLDMTDISRIEQFARLEAETRAAFAPRLEAMMTESMKEHSNRIRDRVTTALNNEREERATLRTKAREQWLQKRPKSPK